MAYSVNLLKKNGEVTDFTITEFVKNELGERVLVDDKDCYVPPGDADFEDEEEAAKFGRSQMTPEMLASWRELYY